MRPRKDPPWASAGDSAGDSHHVVSGFSGGFDTSRCLAWNVAQRVQQAAEFVSWHGVESAEKGRGSEVPAVR